MRSLKNESRSLRGNKFRFPSLESGVSSLEWTGRDSELETRNWRLKTRDSELETRYFNMLRAIAIIFGIVLAAVGGVIAYRAFFLEPSAAIVISSEGTRELPDTFRVVGGIALLIVGAALAFTAALRKPQQ